MAFTAVHVLLKSALVLIARVFRLSSPDIFHRHLSNNQLPTRDRLFDGFNRKMAYTSSFYCNATRINMTPTGSTGGMDVSSRSFIWFFLTAFLCACHVRSAAILFQHHLSASRNPTRSAHFTSQSWHGMAYRYDFLSSRFLAPLVLKY